MKKNRLFRLLAGLLAVMALAVVSCNDGEKWEPEPELTSVSLTTLSARSPSTVNATLGTKGSTPEAAAAAAGSLRLTSVELDAEGEPTLELEVTLRTTQNPGAATVKIAATANDTPPDETAYKTFTNTTNWPLKNGDYLWVQVYFEPENTTVYYVIRVTVEYNLTIVSSPATSKYGTNDTIQPLSVLLSAEAEYTYQWYSNTSNSNTSGTPIDGATDAAYTPTVSTPGTYYYYVKVSFGSITKTSDVGVIVIQDIENIVPATNQFTLDDVRLNYVRGVGGTGSFMFRGGKDGGSNSDPTPDTDIEYIDRLMGEVGLNVLRIMVQDDFENYFQNSVQNWKTTAPYTHNVNPNLFNVIKRVNEYGGYVYANPWTAPGSMKSNADTIGSGGAYLLRNPQTSVDYAEHLRAFLKALNDFEWEYPDGVQNKGAPIFALGIQNEPDFGGGGYEGMAWTGAELRDWFRTTGHFPTQQVTNRTGAGVTSSLFADDIIPGYGGGGPTHHVLAMGGDPMGNTANAYMETLASTGAGGANNRTELLGRHYYGGSSRYDPVAGSANTAWASRPQTGNYVGPYEAESLAMSPQMYHPGATAGNIKREIWQTEHDHNYQSSSVAPIANGCYYQWNSGFAAINGIDYTFRVVGESVHDWWFSQSYSGYVTGIDARGWPASYSLTPRGITAAHMARYVNETWLLGISRTKGTLANNPTTGYNAGHVTPVISGYEDTNGKFISIVMWTPMASTATGNIATATSSGAIAGNFGSGGTNGYDDSRRLSTNVGRIEVVLPEGFVATGATAIRSYGRGIVGSSRTGYDPTASYMDAVDSENGRTNGQKRYWFDELVFLRTIGVDEGDNAGRQAVEVTLPGGNIISIKVNGFWANPGDRYFEERVRPWDLVQSGIIIPDNTEWPN